MQSKADLSTAKPGDDILNVLTLHLGDDGVEKLYADLVRRNGNPQEYSWATSHSRNGMKRRESVPVQSKYFYREKRHDTKIYLARKRRAEVMK